MSSKRCPDATTPMVPSECEVVRFVWEALRDKTSAAGQVPIYSQQDLDHAVAAERERCAAACDKIRLETKTWVAGYSMAQICADAIRSQSDKR